MGKKVYRVLGIYYNSSDNGREVVYCKMFDNVENAINDFYRVINKNLTESGFTLLYNTIMKNYKGYIRQVYMAVDTHCENDFTVELTVDELDEPEIYKSEPMIIGDMPIPQIELDDGSVVKRIRYYAGINDIELEIFSGFLSMEDILFEDNGLRLSDTETFNKITKTMGPWSVDEIKAELKRLYVEKTL